MRPPLSLKSTWEWSHKFPPNPQPSRPDSPIETLQIPGSPRPRSPTPARPSPPPKAEDGDGGDCGRDGQIFHEIFDRRPISLQVLRRPLSCLCINIYIYIYIYDRGSRFSAEVRRPDSQRDACFRNPSLFASRGGPYTEVSSAYYSFSNPLQPPQRGPKIQTLLQNVFTHPKMEAPRGQGWPRSRPRHRPRAHKPIRAGPKKAAIP